MTILAWAVACPPAFAQRTGENVVTAAEDAFGISIGNERLGLYTEDNVRGFNPSASGNIRLNGLYFDRQGLVTPRLVRGATVRVGLTAQGYDFPAPSGIVDYALRLPSGRQVLSTVLSTDSWGRLGLEADADVGVSSQLSLGLGASRAREELTSGADRETGTAGLIARFRPGPETDVTSFASFGKAWNEETQPRIFTGGDYLPPFGSPRRFFGQGWTDARTVVSNHGVIASHRIGDGPTLRGGLFYSRTDYQRSYFDFFLNTARDGTALHVVTANPRQTFTSYSGELRATQRMSEGPRVHALLVTLRARDRTSRYGGGHAVTLGSAIAGVPADAPEPVFRPRQTNVDRVEQRTAGVGYQGVWKGLGELNIGIQRTRYGRDLRLASGSRDTSSQHYLPWNVNGAAYLSSAISAFGGYTRGLEDGGFAPFNAVNANAALPATPTRQADIGLRVAHGNTRLVGAVFQLEKPYFALDAAGVFAPIGEVRSRGLEFSAVTSPLPGLRLVGGVVLTRPRVRTGPGQPVLRPIGSAQTVARVSFDYAWPGHPELSFDGALTHAGPRAARLSGAFFIPQRTTVDLGARYRLKLADHPSTLRLAVTNVGDVRGWSVDSGGGFTRLEPRRFSASLFTDF